MSEKPNLFQRLNAVMGEVGKVSRDKFVQLSSKGNGYKAVTHDNVTSVIRPYLVKHGIYVSVSQTESRVEQLSVLKKGYNGAPDYEVNEYMATVHVDVVFRNIDDFDDALLVKGFAYAMDSSDKAPGKALSYAVKNVLLKNLMLESCDDEESRDFEKDVKKITPRSNAPVLTAGKNKGKLISSMTDDELKNALNWIDSLPELPTGPLERDFKHMQSEYKSRGF